MKEEVKNAYTVLVKNLKGNMWENIDWIHLCRTGLCEHSPEVAIKIHKAWTIS